MHRTHARSHSRSRLARSDRGAAAVEFALVVPLLLLLVLGIVEFGRAYNIQLQLTAAAREGVRAMAITDDPATARQATLDALTFGPDEVEVTPGTAGSCAGNATVSVTYQFEYLTALLGDSPEIELTGKGVMRCNG